MQIDSTTYAVQSGNNSAAASSAVGREENKFRFNIASALFIAAGVTLIIGAAINEYFWNAEKTFLSSKFCLPLATGLSLILIGFCAAGRWKIFARWMGLAIVAQAASLQMIDAGRLIHFQHYRSLPELLNSNFLTVVIIAFQTAFVAVAVRKRLPVITQWLKRTFSIWQIIAIAVFLFFSGAAVTKDASIYANDLLTNCFVQFIGLANILLAVWSVPNDSINSLRRKIGSLFDESKDKPQSHRLDRFAWLAALWVVLLAAILSYFVYERHPHVPDETQYLFQAHYMAAGQLTVEAPPVPEAFSMYMIPAQESHWYGIFPPAFPAMLAIGTKLNAGWLVNPLLAGLCVLLSYLFFQEIYSRRFARIAVLLLCCSPWFVFMAMSFMSHIFTLACALGAAVLLQRALRNGQTMFVFASGVAIGVLSLTRPLDGAIVAVLLGVWTLFKFQGWTAKFKNAVVLIVGTIMTASLVLPYNKAVTGDALLSPMDAFYTKYFWSGVMSLGFGANRGFHWELDAFPGHSPLEAVVNAALNFFQLNTELFGWATGSLLLAVLFIFSGGLRKKDFWAIAVIITVIGSYSLFWYHGGPDFGARYWFLCIIPLIALTIRGIEFLSRKIGSESEMNPRVLLAVLMLCAISIISYFPWRATDKYYHYLEMRPDVQQLARQNNFGKSLVLIRGEEHPDYQSAWIYNPLNFEGDAPIYAWDKNAEIRAALLRAYPNRQVWILDGPTNTNGGYKIVQGPVNAAELSTGENR